MNIENFDGKTIILLMKISMLRDMFGGIDFPNEEELKLFFDAQNDRKEFTKEIDKKFLPIIKKYYYNQKEFMKHFEKTINEFGLKDYMEKSTYI